MKQKLQIIQNLSSFLRKSYRETEKAWIKLRSLCLHRIIQIYDNHSWDVYIFHICIFKSSSGESLPSDKYYCCWFLMGDRSLLYDTLLEALGLVTYRRSSCLLSLFMGLWQILSSCSLAPCIFSSSSGVNCDISLLLRLLDVLKVVCESCMSSFRLICSASVCLTCFSLKTTSRAMITE